MSTTKIQIVGSVVKTDDTLSKSGIAADAKAVGDAITTAVAQKSQVQIITWEDDD